MKNFTRKDWIILVLAFILILTSSSLFRLVDETAVEPLMPWYLSIFALIGFGLSSIVNFPIISILNLINGDGRGASYNSYFVVLPYITAFVYTGVLAAIISKMKKKKTTK
ncbi:MAG: hypothetical protein ABIO72_03355 [Patescibacteria group bacterium]